MSSTHVLIIGGGIGGLALAQGLRKHKITFTIFERDPTPASRAQGYRIRVAGIGAEALYGCLDDKLWDFFEKSCAAMEFGASSLNALDASNLPTPGPPGGFGKGSHRYRSGSDVTVSSKVKPAYTVDRTMLRALLLLGQDENIKFGKSFTHYEITAEGIKAFFADGTSTEGSLLVGADGISSPVRKQLLPHQRYVDVNTRAIFGKTPITPELEASFAAEAMKHITIIRDPTPFLAFLEPVRFQPNIPQASNNRLPQMDNYVYWVFAGATDDMGMSDEDFRHLSGKEAAALTRKLTSKWHPTFKPLFDMQSEEQAAPLRLLSSKPHKPDFSPNSRVTLLGDAVHAMMPAGGSGANVALSDAALLVNLLVETKEKEEPVGKEVMTKFWDEMWELALPAIQASAEGASKLFGFEGFESTKEVDV
ncbi:FAD/NAD(P)-binding domain-containing protein [Mollisia scopiformis]|uniref:FAD/NAD(P)-binding domain-containing protein n=1 Tax=Mollisia scopiformis TaxID=149040 RepID=A0A194XGB9_MOLSC|nr:FAD/NAD(P)-binding domain-containing protein [Mollisia scopiformis]KUJ19181.1 FAD/NAD(P)-binding domain-containing protein [Mollisia scopiformis]